MGFLVYVYFDKFGFKMKTRYLIISFGSAVMMYAVFLAQKKLVSLVTLYFSTVWYIFFWSIAAFLIIQNYRKKTIFKFMLFNIMILLVSTVTAINVLREYPFASRDLAGSVDLYTINYLKSAGAAGYGYIYGIIFLIFGMIRLFLYDKNRLKLSKTILLISIITTAALVIMASYSIAILIMSFLVIFALLASRGKSATGFFVIVFFIMVVLLRIPLLNFLIVFADKVGSEAFSQHMEELLRAVTYQSYEEEILRVQIWLTALGEFAAHPVFGGKWSGGHSFVLKHMALFGSFSSVVFVFICYVFRAWSKFIDKQDLVISVIAFILVTLLNSYAAGESSAMIFMMLPVMLYCKSDFDYFATWNNKEEFIR